MLTFVNTIAFLPSGPEPTMYNVRMAYGLSEAYTSHYALYIDLYVVIIIYYTNKSYAYTYNIIWLYTLNTYALLGLQVQVQID